MKLRADRLRPGVRYQALVAIVALALTSLVICGCGKKEPEVKEIVRPVKMMTIGAGAGGSIREYPGSVRAAEEIQLSFEVPGRIIELHATEGQFMARGALVAAVDPRDFESARNRELARRNEARADFERNRTLYERDAISLRDLEVVRRRFEVTEANLEQAEKALADTRLYAPFDGTRRAFLRDDGDRLLLDVETGAGDPIARRIPVLSHIGSPRPPADVTRQGDAFIIGTRSDTNLVTIVVTCPGPTTPEE